KSGASTVSNHGPALTAPIWLRMTRQNNVIAAFYRTTLADVWTLLGTLPLNALGPTVAVGLPVTSHADGIVTTATVSGVFLQPLPALQALAIGGATGSLDSRFSGGTNWTLTASGTDIWNAADSFMFFATPIGDNQQITFRVVALDNTNVWAKAGPMIRESSAAGSPQADVVVTPGKGIAMLYRPAANAASVDAAQVAATTSVWLRLRRTEPATAGQPSTFAAWFSKDRVTWQPIAAHVAFPMGHAPLVGIAVTSHSPGVQTTALVDDLRVER